MRDVLNAVIAGPIAWIAAAVCFIAGIYVPKLTNAGLALLTVGLIIEFGAKTHDITF